MSQSPPSTFQSKGEELEGVQGEGDGRSHTLPRGAGGRRSLTLPPPTPPLSKVKFASSPSDMYKMDEIDGSPIQYLVAVHRKQCRADAFFLSWQRVRPALFGVPLVVAVRAGEPGRDLYARVWAQLARLLSPRPPHASRDLSNHAADCDDSLGYEFPFTLRLVCGSGAWCALCAWPALCRGCALPSDHKPLLRDPYTNNHEHEHTDTYTDTHIYESQVSVDSGCGLAGGSPAARAKLQRQTSSRLTTDVTGDVSSGEVSYLSMGALRAARRRGLLLAIDWEPTALHLRYQATRERAWVEHTSVAECGGATARPVDLASCLAAFTSEERLEQRYHCDHCRTAQPATKKLQIWRTPPILIIHLKRFQYVNNKWIKSQKVVNFPFEDFDPTPYLASVPQETILRHRELKSMRRRSSMFVDIEGPISETESENSDEDESSRDAQSKSNVERRRESVEMKGRARLQSTSLTATPVTDDNLVDYHQHHLEKDQEPFDLKYKLYAVVSHTGQLHGGHYVAYAHNPSGAWLCYNDSSCRAVDEREVQPASAYLLFYERHGLDYGRYLPARAHGPAPSPPHDADDADMRNMCVLT